MMRLLAALLALPVAISGYPAIAQAPELPMLSSVERGLWQLRYRSGSGPRNVCVRSGQELIKLKHGGSDCSRFVVENGAKQVTVQYTCQGNGYGRTSIRKETASLVQIDSQGISGGMPFELSAEARRTGACR
ncbi:hypothetical protein G7A66_11350 [Altererythrobacter sp. SALINAS58]|nr:hypothetical protein [Alteripontixanthobacter muriae]